MMTKTPDVIFSRSSKLKAQLESIAWQETPAGVLDLEPLLAEPNRARVLVLDSEEAESVWNKVEPEAQNLPWYPLIVSRDSDVRENASVLLRLAPTLEQPIEESIQDTVKNLLGRAGWLYRELSPTDSNAKVLTQNSQCEWDRCSIGIAGFVRIERNSSAEMLSEQLDLLRCNAYALIDRVPANQLATDDLWTLLLIVAVPWSREELNNKEAESAILRNFVGDTTGSRKLIMASNESISSLLGPVARSGSAWSPSSDNPLRDQLNILVNDEEELRALEVLFNKRLSADDFERLIAVLGRKR